MCIRDSVGSEMCIRDRNSINWNSIVRLVRLFSDGYAFAGIFCLLEWLLMGANILFMVMLALKVRSSQYWGK
jgi:hypothetical protein